ncbi:MAG: hypothetical protein PVI44_03770 [Balneolaceae bacterium]|jgi:hypothetical protein
MLDFLNQIGLFGLPLLIIALSVIILTAKYGIKLWGGAETAVDINNIIFLGIFGLSLGIFSHFLGLYQASGFIAQLPPKQIAAGYGQSLLSLLYGFGVFFISAVAWFGLRLKMKKSQQMQHQVTE